MRRTLRERESAVLAAAAVREKTEPSVAELGRKRFGYAPAVLVQSPESPVMLSTAAAPSRLDFRKRAAHGKRRPCKDKSAEAVCQEGTAFC